MLTWFVIVDIVIVVLLLTMAILAGIDHGLRLRANQFFALFSVSIAAWAVSNHLSNDVSIPRDVAYYADFFVFGGSLLALYALIEILNTFIKNSAVRVRLIRWITFIALPIVSSPLLVKDIIASGTVYEIDFGWGIYVYVAVIVWLLGHLIWYLRRGMHSDDHRIVSKTRVFRVGFAFSLPFVLLLGLVIPVITSDFTSSNYAITPLAFFVAIVYYLVIRHGLLDIKSIAIRTLGYVLTLSALAVLYYVAVSVLSYFIYTFTNDSGSYEGASIISVVLAVLLAFVFQPVKSFFDTITNTIFYRKRYKIKDFIDGIGDIIANRVDLYPLMSGLTGEIMKRLGASFVGIVVVFDDGSKLYAKSGDDVASQEVHNVLEYAAQKNSHIIYTGSDNDNQLSMQSLHALRSADISFMFSLQKDDHYMGYVYIGRSRSKKYTLRDMKVLRTVRNELIIAIQNALNLQKVKDLNENLEQRVQDATRKLRRSNERLKKLDATKDEFLSMASHQLRTPLTSVKGYVSMILDEDMGKINDAQREILNEAFTGSERMVRLIGDFLNVSRLQNGKFVIDRVECDLVDVVTHETKSMQQLANTHGINLTFRPPKVFPLLYIDAVKTREVVMNFIDNAIYYTPSGGEVRVKLRVEDGFAVFEVEDTGIGVPKAMQKQLFTKFYRADNARKKRPDGTGVGIYLAKRVIEAQQGHVIFRSVENKGSTFGFRLPIKDTLKEK